MSNSSKQYDADYFLRGKQTGKSLYEDYRWLPELTLPMVSRIASHLGISKEFKDTILDFGCARGYIVRAFREMGYNAYGYDSSEWAINNADEIACHYLTNTPEIAFDQPYDWIIAKDVLEHIEYVDHTINTLLKLANKGVFVVVPLSEFDYIQYVIKEYEADVTHVQRLTLMTWFEKFMRDGWAVTAQYRLPGVKDNYYQSGWTKGNGFITAKRVIG